jgi:hypothetical protein
MITFRFYVVSIVAFFLALAVGVAVGSVLDEGLYNSLQDRLNEVEASLDENVGVIDDKNREISQLEDQLDAEAPHAVAGTVEGTSTLVVVEPGIEGAAVDDLVVRLRQGGSRADGVVWLEPRWDLEDPEDLGRLEVLLGTSGTPGEMRDAAWAQLMARLAPDAPDAPGVPDGSDAGGSTTTAVPGGDATTTAPTVPPTTVQTTPTVPPTTVPPTTSVPGTTAPAGPGIDILSDPLLVALEDAGLVRIERADGDSPAGGADLRVVAVTGTASSFEPPGEAAAEVAGAAAGIGVPSVLAEHWIAPTDGGGQRRGKIIEDARQGPADSLSTVDDFEMSAGRVAVVLALSELADGVSGRYGLGPGTDGPMPEWRGP